MSGDWSSDVCSSDRGVETALTGSAGEAGAAHAELADGIVLLALIIVAQHLVGLGDVLELLLRLLGLVAVGVVLARELAVRLGALLGGGVLGDTKDLVEVFAQPFVLSHSCLLSCCFANK